MTADSRISQIDARNRSLQPVSQRQEFLRGGVETLIIICSSTPCGKMAELDSLVRSIEARCEFRFPKDSRRSPKIP